MANAAQLYPAHPSVSWLFDLPGSHGRTFARVTCPDCRRTRLEPARRVILALRSRNFTGRCPEHVAGARNRGEERLVHPAVDWTSAAVRNGTQIVRVTCPVCYDPRDVPSRSVRAQIKRGTFTGVCGRDRLLGKRRSDSPEPPYSPFVDWSDCEVVPERTNSGAARRRTMIRVRCPVCSEVRLQHPAHLRLVILAGAFHPECSRHRRRGDATGVAAEGRVGRA